MLIVLSTVQALLYLNSSCRTDAPTLFSLNIAKKRKNRGRYKNKIFWSKADIVILGDLEDILDSRMAHTSYDEHTLTNKQI